MTTFYLIRHGLTDAVGQTIAGRLPGTHLNSVGRVQAERVAERLAGEPIRRVYSGPLERARETAEPLARRLQVEVVTAPALDELDFGDWAGRTLEELSSLEKWYRFNTYRSGTRAPGGELMLETQARVVAFLQRLHEEFPTEALALVSHGDVIRAAVLHYLGVPLDLFQRIEISPGSVTALAVREDGPQVLYLNRTEP